MTYTMSSLGANERLTARIITLTLRLLVKYGKLSATALYSKITKQLPQESIAELESKGGIQEILRITRYLKSKNYITKQGRGDLATTQITEAGFNRLQELNFNHLSLDGDPWDGLWRVVTFDIPESHRTARSALRRLLKQLGFKQLHLSVWVHPLPCSDEIKFIKDKYGVHEHITLLEVTTFDEEPKFKQLFADVINA